MHVVLLGPPGSGKGTLATWLQATYALAGFEAGAALRDAARHDTALSAALAAGHMAPTSLILDLFERAVAAAPSGQTGWVYDGVPRNVDQATQCLDRHRAGRWPLDAVLVLDAPVDVLLVRMRDRRICAGCGTTWNLTSAPSPAGATTCRCGAALTLRLEDTPDAIQQRLSLYASKTEPAIALLAAAGVPVLRVRADVSILDVRALVRRALVPWTPPDPTPGAGESRPSRASIGR